MSENYFRVKLGYFWSKGKPINQVTIYVKIVLYQWKLDQWTLWVFLFIMSFKEQQQLKSI